MAWGELKLTKQIRELLNGALKKSDEDLKKLEKEMQGHLQVKDKTILGSNEAKLSDTSVAIMDEKENKIRKELANNLRNIADDIEHHKIL